MSRVQRILLTAIISLAVVATGTFLPDPWLLGVHGLASIIGVAIGAVVVGRRWHQDDYRTRSGLVAMIAGLASIPVCASFQT